MDGQAQGQSEPTGSRASPFYKLRTPAHESLTQRTTCPAPTLRPALDCDRQRIRYDRTARLPSDHATSPPHTRIPLILVSCHHTHRNRAYADDPQRPAPIQGGVLSPCPAVLFVSRIGRPEWTSFLAHVKTLRQNRLEHNGPPFFLRLLRRIRHPVNL